MHRLSRKLYKDTTPIILPLTRLLSPEIDATYFRQYGTMIERNNVTGMYRFSDEAGILSSDYYTSLGAVAVAVLDYGDWLHTGRDFVSE